MKRCKTLVALTLMSGLIGLSEAQFKRRSRSLELVEVQNEDVSFYEIKQAINLKAGEIVTLDDSVFTKRNMSQLKILDDDNDADGIEVVRDNIEPPLLDLGGVDSGSDNVQLDELHWTEIQRRVVEAGGVWSNKNKGIDFLNGVTDNDAD